MWLRRWWSSTAAIAVVVDGGNGGIELMAPMAARSTVAAVDGVSNNGVFITISSNNNRHPHPHCPCPCPCPPLDKNWMAGWGACCDASHSLLPWLLLVAPSLSPLTGQRHQGRQLRRQTRLQCQYPWLGRGGTPRPHQRGATKTKTKTNTKTNTKIKTNTKTKTKNRINNSGGNVAASMPANSYARAATAAAAA